MRDDKPVSSMIVSASPRIVNSPGFPRLTGPVTSWVVPMSHINPPTSSWTWQNDRVWRRSRSRSRNVLIVQLLSDKVWYNPTVIGLHARTVSVEGPSDFDRQITLAAVVEKQRFCTVFFFIMARSWPDRVHAPPIVLGLWLQGRIAISFGG
jgi:hypothetical protein